MTTATLDTATQQGDFLLAGHATLTVVSNVSGQRFTYQVRQCDAKPTLYFVSVLTGSDNTSDYAYFGTLRTEHGVQYTHGSRAKVAADALSVQAFAWYAQHIGDARVTVYHEGRCGRCNRLLTVPESIVSGFGPECSKKLGAAA